MIVEGLIKLPKQLFEETQEFLLHSYFSYILNFYSTSDRAEKLINASLKDYNFTRPKASSKTSYMKNFKIEENLYDQTLKMKLKLKIVFERHKLSGSSGGSYFDDRDYIVISPYNLHMTRIHTDSALANSLAKLPALISYLKHELTHVVQHKLLHHDQYKMHKEYSKYSDDYKLSPIEFDPLIKTNIERFKLIIRKYNNEEDFDYDKCLNYFVSAGPKPKYMFDTDQSTFFKTLNIKADTKWKKAVKLFTSEINK